MLDVRMFTALREVFKSSLRTIVKAIQVSNLALGTDDFAELGLKKTFEFSLLTSMTLLHIICDNETPS